MNHDQLIKSELKSELKSGFIDNNVIVEPCPEMKLKCTKNINIIKLELKNILTEFTHKIRSFKDVVDGLHQLIGTYDFNFIKIVMLEKYKNSDLTYLDKIVSLLWCSPTISSSYYSLMGLVVYIYPTIIDKTLAIKNIAKLTSESYYKIMDSTNKFTFEEIYSNENLSAVCAYAWIFAEYLNKIPELWDLLDNSVVYSYQLYCYITLQIEYVDIIVNTDPGYVCVLEELKFFQKQIGNLIRKFPNWILSLNMNPLEYDQYRIYYLINVVVEQFKIGSINMFKFQSTQKIAIHDSLMHVLPCINPSEASGMDIVNIFLDASNKVPVNQEMLIHENVTVMKNINTFLVKFKYYFKKFFESSSSNELFSEWMHKYLGRIINTLDLISYNEDQLGPYSYIIVNVKQSYKITLDSLRILMDLSDLREKLNLDVRYQYRNLLIAIIKYIDPGNSKFIIGNSELVALTIILFNLIENLPNTELAELKNEHNLEILYKLVIPVPDNLNDRLHNLTEINYPDEFLDPITDHVITTPVQLPETLQILDQKVIYHILRNNPFNPFSMKPLTIKDLDEHNEKEEIKALLCEFMNKKLNFITLLNKK
jgi:hypothetical protein